MTRSRRHGLAIRPGRGRVELGSAEAAALHAAVLALDAARTTGAAFYARGQLRAWDEVDAHDPHARHTLVSEAIEAANLRGLPLACVVETPYGGHMSAALSLTATVALWRDTWRALGRPELHFMELTVGQWRRAVFGRQRMAREQARAREAHVALGYAYRDVPRKAEQRIGPDAAAAICLGSVACRSSGVRARLQCDLVRPVLTLTPKEPVTHDHDPK